MAFGSEEEDMSDLFADIHADKDEFTYARRLLADGKADRDDRLTFTRNGKPAISATVGWWADHTVRETETDGPRFVRWKPFPAARRPALTAKSGLDRE